MIETLPSHRRKCLIRGRDWSCLVLFSAVLAAALAGCSTTAEAPAAPSIAAKVTAPSKPAQWNYLSADAIDFPLLLPPPVDAVSPKAREFEAELVASLRRVEMPALRERAERDETDSVWHFAVVMGPEFSAEQCPKIAALMQRVTGDGNRIKNLAKDHFERRRPPTATEAGATYASAHAQAAESEDWSYPSGHATRAALWACVLGEVDPSQKESLLREGWFMCLSRMSRGVHFPSDVTGGFILGQAIAREIMDSPEAAADIEAAREEWETVSRATAG